jgi:diketogulonate reductase-like aldo/keto reductase
LLSIVAKNGATVNIPVLKGSLGLSLPAIGLGTYKLSGEMGADAMIEAARGGYRLFDSAVNYENEGAVGSALRRSGIRREELIFTSKLPGRHHRYDEALTTVEESVMRSGLDAIDLYLIHWPNPLEDLYVEAWAALVDARNRGLVRHSGVSNFLPAHLERLKAETGEMPTVNQIEMHPNFPQAELRAFHDEHGILTEAWSPLGRGNDLLVNPVIVEVAAEHGITTAQTILAWHVHLCAIPLPKSKTPERQRENLEIFDVALSEHDVELIGTLASPEGRLAAQDPAVYQEF